MAENNVYVKCSKCYGAFPITNQDARWSKYMQNNDLFCNKCDEKCSLDVTLSALTMFDEIHYDQNIKGLTLSARITSEFNTAIDEAYSEFFQSKL